MIDQWYSNISFEKYYNSCRPLSCSYTLITHQNIIYLLTTFIGLFSGLTEILRFVIPRFIKQVRKRERNDHNQRYIDKFSIFPIKPTDDDYKKTTKRIMTILYLILFSLSFTTITLYFSLITNLKNGVLKSPTVQEYNETILKYPTMICPCKNLAIVHEDFLFFHPRFHQLCSSHFIEPLWINILINLNRFTDDGDFQKIAFAQFRTLRSLCELSNRTVFQAIEAFNTEHLITASLLSKDIFERQSQTLINTFISSISNNFIQALNLLDITTKGNDLFSALFTNYRMIVNDNQQIDSISMKYKITNQTFCDCSEKNEICMQETKINSFPIHGFYIGCYLIDVLRQSTLECFYNQSCLSKIDNSTRILPLNSTIISKYTINTTIDDLLKNLMIEQWNEMIIYTNYFNACNASNCTYIYSTKNSVVLIISNVIGLLAGLHAVLRFIIPLIIKNLRRKSSNEDSTGCQSIQRLKTSIYSYTIFRHPQSDDQQTIRLNILATRFYFLILIILMIVYSFYTLNRTVENTRTIKNPTIEQFDDLYKNYSNTLICQCNEISIKYRDIFSIKPIYHSICSSDFLTEEWINDLKNLSHQFKLLQSFCQISHDTTELAINEFLENIYISGIVLHKTIFEHQTKATIIDLFISSTQQSFKRSLDLIRITTFSNQILSSRFTNWKFRLFYHRYHQKWLTTNAPVTYRYMNTKCDCFQSNQCKEQYRSIRNFYFGCLILESLFQSTLECFYDSQCIYPMRNLSNIHMESKSNETIEHIVERLMINEWKSNVQYKNYYQKCNPKFCIYRINENHTLIYLISMLIVIYSGLSHILKILLQIIIKSIRSFQC
jgi:hypothetical protein